MIFVESELGTSSTCYNKVMSITRAVPKCIGTTTTTTTTTVIAVAENINDYETNVDSILLCRYKEHSLLKSPCTVD